MTKCVTIYGFKRPDGSVVVDTICTSMESAAHFAEHLYEEAYTILPLTLGPDGAITPKE